MNKFDWNKEIVEKAVKNNYCYADVLRELNIPIAGNNTNTLKSYHYKYKNGAQIPRQSKVYTKFFSYQENDNIVGFKWLTCNCSENVPCATVLFDMNGTEKNFNFPMKEFVLNSAEVTIEENIGEVLEKFLRLSPENKKEIRELAEKAFDNS